MSKEEILSAGSELSESVDYIDASGDDALAKYLELDGNRTFGRGDVEIFARRGPIARLSRDYSSASIREGQIVKDDRTGLSVYLGGELEIWSCLLIVLASTAAAWWLYRLETKKEPPGLWTSSSLFSGPRPSA